MILIPFQTKESILLPITHIEDNIFSLEHLEDHGKLAKACLEWMDEFILSSKPDCSENLNNISNLTNIRSEKNFGENFKNFQNFDLLPDQQFGIGNELINDGVENLNMIEDN